MTYVTIPRALLEANLKVLLATHEFIKPLSPDVSKQLAYLINELTAALAESEKLCFCLACNPKQGEIGRVCDKKSNPPLVLTKVIEDGGNYIDENGNKHELKNTHVYKPKQSDEELAREFVGRFADFCEQTGKFSEAVLLGRLTKAFAKVREDASDEGSLWRVWLLAFLEGAKFWEWQKTKATMWQSDQELCYEEAIKRHNQFATIRKEYEK